MRGRGCVVDSFKFARDPAGVWHVTQAPHQVELMLPEICGANPNIMRALGRHLVVCNEVRYMWVGSNLDTGHLLFLMDHDDRENSC